IQVELSRRQNQAWRYLQQEQAEDAEQTLSEGVDMARKAGLPCWELKLESIRAQIPIYYTFNLEAAVKMAVKLTTLAREPRYEKCSERVSVYDALIHAYFYRDCIGYETEILVAANYIETEFSREKQYRWRMQYIRAEIDLEWGRYDEAKERIDRYLASVQKDYPLRMADGYWMLYRLEYARGNFSAALSAARNHEKHNREGEYQRGTADSQLVQAVCSKHLANVGIAQATLQRAVAHYKQYNLARTLLYYDALATFHELDGNLETAYSLRREQFETLSDHGNLLDLAKAHLQHIRLCGRMQKPLEDPIQAAYIFKEDLRKSDWFMERLQAIMNGNYYEFPWQAP
ncbi:MAG: hypothetical protein KC496_15215, partial [Anaerolineae bacterium]|nr:hypothetical protein [Anaerolineae bacterium]